MDSNQRKQTQKLRLVRKCNINTNNNNTNNQNADQSKGNKNGEEQRKRKECGNKIMKLKLEIKEEEAEKAKGVAIASGVAVEPQPGPSRQCHDIAHDDVNNNSSSDNARKLEQEASIPFKWKTPCMSKGYFWIGEDPLSDLKHFGNIPSSSSADEIELDDGVVENVLSVIDSDVSQHGVSKGVTTDDDECEARSPAPKRKKKKKMKKQKKKSITDAASEVNENRQKDDTSMKASSKVVSEDEAPPQKKAKKKAGRRCQVDAKSITEMRRERSRLFVQEMSEAFKALRDVLPCAAPKGKIMTRIQILRAATGYINFLEFATPADGRAKAWKKFRIAKDKDREDKKNLSMGKTDPPPSSLNEILDVDEIITDPLYVDEQINTESIEVKKELLEIDPKILSKLNDDEKSNVDPIVPKPVLCEGDVIKIVLNVVSPEEKQSNPIESSLIEKKEEEPNIEKPSIVVEQSNIGTSSIVGEQSNIGASSIVGEQHINVEHIYEIGSSPCAHVPMDVLIGASPPLPFSAVTGLSPGQYPPHYLTGCFEETLDYLDL